MMKTIKNLLLISSLIFLSHDILAQSIKFKKGKVWVGGKECLDNNSSDVNNVALTTPDGKQTIFLKFIRTGYGHNGGLYTKVIFVEQKKSLTSRSYIFTKKLLVKKLLESQVIVDCAINEDNIDKFIMQYDEQVEDNLLRF